MNATGGFRDAIRAFGITPPDVIEADDNANIAAGRGARAVVSRQSEAAALNATPIAGKTGEEMLVLVRALHAARKASRTAQAQVVGGKIRKAPANRQACASCNGSGQDPSSDATCETCAGSGWEPHAD